MCTHNIFKATVPPKKMSKYSGKKLIQTLVLAPGTSSWSLVVMNGGDP